MKELKELIVGMFKMNKKNAFNFKLIILSIFQFSFFSINSQVKNISFSFFNQSTHKNVSHSSIQPLLESHLIKINKDSIYRKSTLGRKWWEESLLDIVQDDVSLKADPLFNFTFGRNIKESNTISSNVRGFRISGDITSKVSFETRFYENQFTYPEYLNEKALNRAEKEPTVDAIAFGIGRAKKFKENGLDASLANGYISFSPRKKMNFQLGHGRHFFGNGYRSLLISDYSPDYPYISGQYYILKNKILYKHVNAWMSNLNRIPFSSTAEALFIPKTASFNQISFQLSNKFNFSLFEGVIYNSFDTIVGRTNPNLTFYLPIFGFGVFERNSNSSSNVIYGLNCVYSISNVVSFYNQLSLSHTNKLGFQLGIKAESLFGTNRSFMNLEYNSLPSAFYSLDISNLFQSYSHLSHELAHPLGSGFQEFVLKGQISHKSLFLRCNYNYAFLENSSYNEVFQSIEEINNLSKNTLIFLNTSVGLYFNPKTNMEISLGHITRYLNSQIDNYFMISWRTYLKNDYFDQ